MKVWGPEQGRWKQVCAEEKFLTVTPEQGQGAGSWRGGIAYLQQGSCDPGIL